MCLARTCGLKLMRLIANAPRLLALILLLSMSMASVVDAAPSAPVDVLQSPDGTLYLEQGNSLWTLVPDHVVAEDLRAYSRPGQIDGTIPAGYLDTTASDALDVAQSDDGALYVIFRGNLWTLVPKQV